MSKESIDLTEIQDKLEQLRAWIEKEGERSIYAAHEREDSISKLISKMDMVESNKLKKPYIL